MMIVGIDNGLDGGIVVLVPDTESVGRDVMPTIGNGTNGKRLYDVCAMVTLMVNAQKMAKEDGLKLMVYLEKAHVMPKNGALAAFSTGYGSGVWMGILNALNISYEIVYSKTWQNELFTDMNRADTKQCSALIASRLKPGVDWRATERSKKMHDGLTDAFCIAEYGRRKQLHAPTHPNG